MEDSSARASERSHTRPGNNGAALGRTAPYPVRSLATEFPRRLWLLIGCGFLGFFTRFLLLLFSDAGPESLRVDFEERGSDAQGVILFVFGRPFGGAQKHCLEDEHCQSSTVRLLVECPGLFGHLIVAGGFRVLQTMPLCEAARQFVWQGAQCKARHHPHLFGSKLRLHTFENVGHKAVPERNSLLRLPVCGCLFRFELKALLFFPLSVAEMNLAIWVGADFDETPFFHAICMNCRLEVVTEALFWSGILPLFRFPRNDFDVVAASENWCITRRVVVLRNHHEIRHLRDALRDVRVELAIETRGIGTRILPDLGEE